MNDPLQLSLQLLGLYLLRGWCQIKVWYWDVAGAVVRTLAELFLSLADNMLNVLRKIESD